MVKVSYFLIREPLSYNVYLELAIYCDAYCSYSQLFQVSAGILS